MKAFPKQAYSHVSNTIPVMGGGGIPSYGVGNSSPTMVTVYPDQSGMDLRDYFAAKAMQGYISRTLIDGFDEDVIAEMSYKVADAMIKARAE